MPISVRRALDFAWLSQASYRDFSGLLSTSSTEDISDRLTNANRLSPPNRFAQRQARALLGLDPQSTPTDGFAFISHRPNDATGFSATVFKAKNANEFTFAVRGTETSGLQAITDLFKADVLGIALKGRNKYGDGARFLFRNPRRS